MSEVDYRELGNKSFKEGNFEEAAKWYTKGIEATPEAPVLYNNRAACYLSLQKFAQAESDATRSISRGATAKAHNRLARAIAGQGGRNAEALDNFQKACVMEPANQSFKDDMESYKKAPQETTFGTFSGFAQGANYVFFLDMGMIVTSVLHLICLLFAPGIAVMLWQLALVIFGARQVLGILKTGGFPAINMQFFSQFTSNFSGQYLILCAVLLITRSPPMHLVLFACCIYCLLDMVDYFKSDLDNVVSRLPGIVRNFVESKIQSAVGSEGRQHLQINAISCEIMSIPFALIGGGGMLVAFVLFQFVKWRYQSDAFVKRTFTMAHAALLQLTTHQYCPGIVRAIYEKLAELLGRMV